MLEKIADNCHKAIGELKQIEDTLKSKKSDASSRVAVDSKMVRPMSRINTGPIGVEDENNELLKQIDEIIGDIIRT